MNDLSALIEKCETLNGFIDKAAKPVVAVLGSFNSGKSTLVNRLLGMEISPVGIIPTTSCLICFDYGISFRASLSGTSKKAVFFEPAHLHSYLEREKPAGGRLNIQVPSPLLKKCLLLDTPGIDSLNKNSCELAEKAAREADKIIYLFHQRGIEDFNQLFLSRLAKLWQSKNLGDISFWLNCNLGVSDGTSLAATAAALRKIFFSPVRLNTINTLDADNIETLRLFLELELIRETLRQATANLKKIDLEIPARIKKTAGIKDEALFLSEIWSVYEISRAVLAAGQVIHSIPVFSKELTKRIESMNSSNLGGKNMNPSGRPFRPRTADIRANRQALLDLIRQLLDDAAVTDYLDRPTLERLYSQIAQERFTIVVSGGFSTGKSTFINALLKENLLPAGDGPTTAAVTTVAGGSRKRAVIYTPLQSVISIIERVGDEAVLDSGAAAALARIVMTGDSGISKLEAYVDGQFVPADRFKIAGMLREAKELFAAGAFARAAGDRAVPEVFKRLPWKRLARKKLLQKVRLTFSSPGSRGFDLEKPDLLQSFWNTLGADSAFMIEKVEIEHPSDFLKLAVLVDTPGLDWIHRRHYEKTARSILQGDAYLFFLNGKHILNKMDRDSYQDLFCTRQVCTDEAYVKKSGGLFYVINFADTLTALQRETVYNFVTRALAGTENKVRSGDHKPRVFLISALQGLTGAESGMSTLLKSLEQTILTYRGRNFYLVKANQLYASLDAAALAIDSLCLEEQLTTGAKKSLREAWEILRASKRKLKDIRNSIFDAGRF